MTNKFQKIFQKLDTGFLIVIVIGIIVMINFFSYNIFFRFDLTENKDYSISQASKKTIQELGDVVNINTYFSENLPSRHIALTQEVKDILDEYASYSNNKIKIKSIAPDDTEETAKELYYLGIPELQFNVFEKDKYQVTRGYLGMVIKYGDKKEVIPVVENTRNLEYQITLAIKKLTSDQMPIVGYITDSEGEMEAAFKKLRELYVLRKINLETQDEVPQEITTLVIIAKDDLVEDSLKKIDDFLMQGKSLLVLSNGVNVEEGLIPLTNDSELNKLLEKYGVKINNDLILDVKSGFTTFSQGFISFSINYPLWPKITKQGFDQNNAAVSRLESVIFPWASSVSNVDDQMTESRQVSYLTRTTDRSWQQFDNFNLDPEQMFFPSGEVGQHDLSISVFGKFNSVYTNKSTENGRLIVVGDSDFIQDRYMRQSADNLLFFQNLVDILSIDEDLINIRSKGVTDRPIKEISDNLRIFLRYVNVFGVTIIVIVFGLFRYYKRHKKNTF